MVWCVNCAQDKPTKDVEGKICCSFCGKVLEEDNFSIEPTFVKNASGQSQLSGSRVSTIQSNYSVSRERTLKEAYEGIEGMLYGLGIDGGDSIARPALSFYTIAVEKSFTRGRRKEQVQAACLYIACRENKKPFLLIDFSEYLRINVYVLGAVFLQLCKILHLEDHPIVQKPVDPSLFIHRFTDRLFGGRKPNISRSALHILASMKRDWMQTGRKPSGLCGAALYIASLSHGLSCSKSEIIKVVHICEATLTKRLISQESILIYVAMSGSMVPMRVLEYDSIDSVKLQIQTCKGFVVKNQKLVCGGRELARSNSLIKDYGVGDGNILHLVLKLSDLQVINVKTASGEEFTFNVERSRDVGYVKRQIAKKKGALVDSDEQEVLCNGERLEDQRLIHDICKNNDAVIHLFVRKSAKIRARPVERNFELSIVAPQLNDKVTENRSGSEVDNKLLVSREPPDRASILEPIIVNPKIEVPLVISDLIGSTLEGLDRGHYPIRSSEGTGGAYFMLDATGSKKISVFKPIDEEPMAVNNPRGLPLSVDGEGLKKGTRVGEGALRECAAYLLDHPKNGRRSFSGEALGFAGVPPTAIVKCLHSGFNHPDGITPKIGSLQQFMDNNGSCEDMGPNAFPVGEVHKIAVLDMRMANADRHSGNILMGKGEDGQVVLIPIDHGYCLPESFEDVTFDWLYWPQARRPFSSETIEYIKSLDAEEDIALLKFYGWDMPLESARTLRISTMLLKKGVERGLTPFTIGNIMCRETLNKESVIEEIVQEALDSVLPDSSEDAFLETVSRVMDRCLDEIAY